MQALCMFRTSSSFTAWPFSYSSVSQRVLIGLLSVYLPTPLAVVNILIHIYAVHAWPETATASKSRGSRKNRMGSKRRGRTHRNGHAISGVPSEPMNGHVRTPSETQRVRDAEAFELEGLMSDDGEDMLDVHGNRRDEENIPLVSRGDVDSDAVEIKDIEERR